MISKKTFLFFILLFIIALCIAVINMVYRNKTSFLSLTHTYSKESYIKFYHGELLSGNKVTGKFKAHDNNLGIVAVRFLTYRKVSADVFIFRLKEKGSNKWHYENEYKAKEFGGYPLFPFGFPIISKSEGKEYYFELESLYGRPERAVGISREEPAIAVKHKFTATQLLSDKKELVLFLSKKSKEMLQDTAMVKMFLQIYFVLLIPFFIIGVLRKLSLPKITSSTKRISRSIKKIQMHSRMGVYWPLRFFILSKIVLLWIKRMYQFIVLVIIKKLSSFHRWLGAE